MGRRVTIIINMDDEVYEFLNRWAGDRNVCKNLEKIILNGGLEIGLWLELPFDFHCREEEGGEDGE